MKRLAQVGVAAFLAVVLSGCVTIGTDFDEQVANRIQKGKTTKAQIQDWLGSPYEKGLQDGMETWTYRFIKKAGFSQEQSKELAIWFEKSGVVNTYSYTTNFSPWQISR